MNKSSTTQAIFPALALAQGEMPAVKMNSQNPFLKNKYADLGAVIETSRPILAKHGLAIIQTPVSDGDKIGVTTMLIHSSGEWVEETIFINTSESKGLSSAQTVGVTISYLRRYSWASFLGLYADEDTDGNKSDAKPMQKTEQPKPDQRASIVKRYEELADKAVKLGLTNVMVLTPEMSIDDINAIGKTLKLRVTEKESK